MCVVLVCILVGACHHAETSSNREEMQAMDPRCVCDVYVYVYVYVCACVVIKIIRSISLWR